MKHEQQPDCHVLKDNDAGPLSLYVFPQDDNIVFHDLGIFLQKQKALVISDIHTGYEEALRKDGFMIPRHQMKDVEKKLSLLLEKTRPEIVIVNGDIKHEFGTISDQEWKDTLKLIGLITRHSKLILVKGNHDTVLGPIAERKDVKVVPYVSFGDVYICHGHELPKDDDFKRAKTVIIGHIHPAVSIRDSVRCEMYKAFLIGKFKKAKDLIVMPSFSQITEGSDVQKEIVKNPFVTIKGISRFSAIIVSDRLYDFGEIGKFDEI